MKLDEMLNDLKDVLVPSRGSLYPNARNFCNGDYGRVLVPSRGSLYPNVDAPQNEILEGGFSSPLGVLYIQMKSYADLSKRVCSRPLSGFSISKYILEISYKEEVEGVLVPSRGSLYPNQIMMDDNEWK